MVYDIERWFCHFPWQCLGQASLLKMQSEKHSVNFNGILPDILRMQLCVYFLKRSNQLPLKKEILHLELKTISWTPSLLNLKPTYGQYLDSSSDGYVIKIERSLFVDISYQQLDHSELGC